MLRVSLSGDAPEAWSSLCREDPRATLFMHPRWIEALTRAYPQLSPRYLVAEIEGRVAGLIPYVERRRWAFREILSLPYGTHGGPILARDAPPETAGALGEAMRKLAEGPRTMRFEMTVYDPPQSLREALSPSLGGTFQDFRTHIVDLSAGFDALWGRDYFRNTRNCVRMSERAGVTVKVEKGSETVSLLADLYADQSKSWQGIVPYSRSALETVVDVFGEDARIYVARREGQALAACLNLEQGGVEVHAWASGATLEARPVRAYHHLMNTAIREACERGFRVWNFGGSGGLDKVEFFKESFAGKPVPVLRCFRVAEWRRRLRRGAAWD